MDRCTFTQLQHLELELLLVDKDGSHSHPTPDTHTSHEDFLTSPFRMREGSCELTGTSASKRMAHGDSASVRVNLLMRNAEVLDGEQRLGGESLVYLKEVDV